MDLLTKFLLMILRELVVATVRNWIIGYFQYELYKFLHSEVISNLIINLVVYRISDISKYLKNISASHQTNRYVWNRYYVSHQAVEKKPSL